MLISFPGFCFISFCFNVLIMKSRNDQENHPFCCDCIVGEGGKKCNFHSSKILTKTTDSKHTEMISQSANLWFWGCHSFSIMQFHLLLGVAAAITSPLFFFIKSFQLSFTLLLLLLFPSVRLIIIWKLRNKFTIPHRKRRPHSSSPAKNQWTNKNDSWGLINN